MKSNCFHFFKFGKWCLGNWEILYLDIWLTLAWIQKSLSISFYYYRKVYCGFVGSEASGSWRFLMSTENVSSYAPFSFAKFEASTYVAFLFVPILRTWFAFLYFLQKTCLQFVLIHLFVLVRIALRFDLMTVTFHSHLSMVLWISFNLTTLEGNSKRLLNQ